MSTKQVLLLEEKLISRIDNFCSSRYWKIKALFIVVAVSIFFSCPTYNMLSFQNIATATLEKKIKHPFQKKHTSPGSHQSKLTYRMTIPIIAHYLHLSIRSIKIIEIIAAIALLWFSLGLAYQITRDKITSFMIGISIATLYSGNAGFVDELCYFDAIPYCLLVMCIAIKSPSIIVLLSSAAFWCDERALINSSLVMLYYILPRNLDEKINLKSCFRSMPLALLSSWFLYFLGRYLLNNYCGFTTDTGKIGINVFLLQINHIPAAVWSAFEGLWFLILLSLFSLKKYKHPFFLMMYLGAFIIGIITACSVYDIARSIAYLLPGIFIALKVVSYVEKKDIMQKISLRMAIICMLALNYYYIFPFKMELTNPILPIQLYKNISLLVQQVIA